MIVHNLEDPVGVDIDETLVFIHGPKMDGDGLILRSYDLILTDPYGVLGDIYLTKHKPNINMIKRGYVRGQRYFAWTRAGYRWAEAVVKALDIEYCFEFCMTKPTKYIDDLPVQEWMTDRSYLDPLKHGWQID